MLHTLPTNIRVGPVIEARLMASIEAITRRPDDCYEWVGGLDREGYGRIRSSTGTMAAHRAIWLMLRGPIPDGLVIDHLCRNRACVNVNHLDVVTDRENIRRGLRGALRTHCAKGHPFAGHNLIVAQGRRYCRECRRVSAAKSNQRRALAS